MNTSSSQRSFDGTEVDETLARTLDSLDDAENYRDWILDLAGPYLVAPILEVGAGHGTFTENLSTLGSVTAVEPDEYAAGILSERFDDDPQVTAINGTVDDVDAGPYGSAVMINVLEHIADDQATLRAIRSRLAPEGALVVWVPAFQFLYSRFDAKLGHERRYRLKQLTSDLSTAGFEIVDARYVNLPGWFSWLLLVRLLRSEPTSPRMIRLFDRRVVPIVRWIEERVHVPFGQNVFVVARKSASS